MLQSVRKEKLAHYFPYDVKLGILADSRSFLANQKARNAIVGAENLLKGISQIHDIRYEEGDIRFWKAFDIGKGKRLIQDTMSSAEIPKVKVVQAFPEAYLSSGTMARSSKHTEEEEATPTDTENVESDALFECPTDGCTCSFDSETELQRHLDVGNHVRRLHRVSV